MNMNIDSGVFGLLVNANARSSFEGEKYYFKGDLCQMSIAQQVANNLGIDTDINGGLPFVMSKEDFTTVTQYIISRRMEGWWHYVSKEEYRQLKGE